MVRGYFSIVPIKSGEPRTQQMHWGSGCPVRRWLLFRVLTISGMVHASNSGSFHRPQPQRRQLRVDAQLTRFYSGSGRHCEMERKQLGSDHGGVRGELWRARAWEYRACRLWWSDFAGTGTCRAPCYGWWCGAKQLCIQSLCMHTFVHPSKLRIPESRAERGSSSTHGKVEDFSLGFRNPTCQHALPSMDATRWLQVCRSRNRFTDHVIAELIMQAQQDFAPEILEVQQHAAMHWRQPNRLHLQQPWNPILHDFGSRSQNRFFLGLEILRRDAPGLSKGSMILRLCSGEVKAINVG